MRWQRFARHDGLAYPVGDLPKAICRGIPREHAGCFAALRRGVGAEGIGAGGLRSPRASSAAPSSRTSATKRAKFTSIGIRRADAHWIPKALHARWVPGPRRITAGGVAALVQKRLRR